MDEFIFGTLATDYLKVLHHRNSRRGVQHQHHLDPRDPVPGQPIVFTVRTGPDVQVDRVVCYFTVDGSVPLGALGIPQNGQVINLTRDGVEWDTVTWGYQTRWSGCFPPLSENASVRYQIGAWGRGTPERFADSPLVKAASDAAAAAHFRGDLVRESFTPEDSTKQRCTFALSVDCLQPPAWARLAVIYQVFVDRFYPGQGREWLQVNDLTGICGGTLWGASEKLDYIADLGINCVWLSPVFCSPSHHGYDVTDYSHVEPRLGGDDALHRFVEGAHERSIRVVLDLALNHLSHLHPLFIDAQSSLASPYRDWFTFDDSPIGYRAFFDVPTMPQVNAGHPDARQWLIDIGLHCLRAFDVDGFRLDVADGPGPDFWTDFWTSCKAVKDDCFCFGEVVDAPDIQMQYVGRLDGLLDFQLCDAIRRTFARGQWDEAALQQFTRLHRAYFPHNFLMMSFIDNHDMDRFLLCADNKRELLRRAAEFQMELESPPIIYYGTEIGLTHPTGARDGLGLHTNRVPMQWGDHQDTELLKFYKDIIRRRHTRFG